VTLQREAHQTVSGLLSLASKEAVVSLDEHASRIKQANRDLRRRLLEIIKENKVMEEREASLLRQKKDLMRQVEMDERSPTRAAAAQASRRAGRTLSES
jgi:hypothetical protein